MASAAVMGSSDCLLGETILKEVEKYACPLYSIISEEEYDSLEPYRDRRFQILFDRYRACAIEFYELKEKVEFYRRAVKVLADREKMESPISSTGFAVAQLGLGFCGELSISVLVKAVERFRGNSVIIAVFQPGQPHVRHAFNLLVEDSKEAIKVLKRVLDSRYPFELKDLKKIKNAWVIDAYLKECFPTKAIETKEKMVKFFEEKKLTQVMSYEIYSHDPKKARHWTLIAENLVKKVQMATFEMPMTRVLGFLEIERRLQEGAERFFDQCREEFKELKWSRSVRLIKAEGKKERLLELQATISGLVETYFGSIDFPDRPFLLINPYPDLSM